MSLKIKTIEIIRHSIRARLNRAEHILCASHTRQAMPLIPLWEVRPGKSSATRLNPVTWLLALMLIIFLFVFSSSLCYQTFLLKFTHSYGICKGEWCLEKRYVPAYFLFPVRQLCFCKINCTLTHLQLLVYLKCKKEKTVINLRQHVACVLTSPLRPWWWFFFPSKNTSSKITFSHERESNRCEVPWQSWKFFWQTEVNLLW